jgi:hypothetical protein
MIYQAFATGLLQIGVIPDQTFRGTEEETRQFLGNKGQFSLQIQTPIDRAQDSPEITPVRAVLR